MAKGFFKNKKDMMRDLPKVLGTSVTAGAAGIGTGYVLKTAIPKWTKPKLDSAGNPVKDAAGNALTEPMLSDKMSTGLMLLAGVGLKAITDNEYGQSAADGSIGVSSMYAVTAFNAFGDNTKSYYGLAGTEGVGAAQNAPQNNDDQYIDWDAQNALLMNELAQPNPQPTTPYNEETSVDGVEESVANSMM